VEHTEATVMERLTPQQRRELVEAVECIGYQLLRIEEQLAAIGERLGAELPRPAPRLADGNILDALTGFDPTEHTN
jgi:hypothetical protein